MKHNFGIQNGIAFYYGNGFITKSHYHYALELIFSTETPFEILSDGHSHNDCTSIAILPNHKHQFIGHKGYYLFIFLDPQLLLTKEIINNLKLKDNKVKVLTTQIGIPNKLDIENITHFINALKLSRSTSKNQLKDERIINVMNHIKANVVNQSIRLHHLTEIACLSESRLHHLFKQEVGISIRKYILWCRVQESLKKILTGYNITESAHLAGFSDSAHFSRSFSNMFGLPPSDIFLK